jgi:hypothetical protein
LLKVWNWMVGVGPLAGAVRRVIVVVPSALP